MSTILLADDHPFLRTGLRALLLSSHHKIIGEVDNGRDALSAVERLNPEIVILDVSMPELDGIQVLEQLRTSGDQRRIVLLTAALTDRHLLRAVRSEVNGIVLKTGAEDHLIRCLDTVARGQKAIPRDLMERALALAMQPSESPLDSLAPREREIALLVGNGLRNREVAARLSMTEGTIKVYLHEIYQKLGVSNRLELSILLNRQREID